MDNKIDSSIKEKNIPVQLKVYFQNSKRGKKLLNEQMLESIEELYIYYNALYLFDETEFSAFTITTLERGSEHSAYYYYLKKILDNQMELLPKVNVKNYINGNKVDFIKLFEDFNTELYEKMHCFYEDHYNEIEFSKLYILLGQLKLISDLTENQNLIEIYETSVLRLEVMIKDYNMKLYSEETKYK